MFFIGKFLFIFSKNTFYLSLKLKNVFVVKNFISSPINYKYISNHFAKKKAFNFYKSYGL